MQKIYTTPNPVEIDYLQEKLSVAGINSQIVEERSAIVASDGYVYNYSIIVNDADLPGAERVLSDFLAEQRKLIQSKRAWCPKCGSHDVDVSIESHKYGSVLFLVCPPIFFVIAYFLRSEIRLASIFGVLCIASLYAFFNGYKLYKYQCKQCGHRYKGY